MLDMIELLGSSGNYFHTCVVFTYAFDFTLYDGLIRRALKRSGVLNQIVFCDLQCYDASLREAATTLYLGKQYSVTPIHQKGAFHPKMYLLLGSHHGRLLVGSGNATFGGLIRNAELFGLFDYDSAQDSGPHPALSQCFKFAQQCASAASPLVLRQLKNAAQAATWLDLPSIPDGRTLFIGGPGRPPLLEQIRPLLPNGKADSLVICSSSFDRQLKGLQSLASLSTTKPICIVQPETVLLDGKTVASLGKAIDWRAFEDPYPKEKRKRADAKAHAKLFLFGHGSLETCVFGSANASAPALNAINTEAVLTLPPKKKGEIIKSLGLDTSLKGKPIGKDLEAQAWKTQTNALLETDNACFLAGATLTEGGYRLTVSYGEPPISANIALSVASFGSPQASILLERDKEGWLARITVAEGQMRFIWLTASNGSRISNTVAITFAEVASARRAGKLGTKLSESIATIQEGSMLGTVLFELLDRFRDFEVVRAGTKAHSTKPKASANPDSSGSAQPTEYFYTDEPGKKAAASIRLGDRLDLDILASLVQPLTRDVRGIALTNEDEYYDDSKLLEEAEHRQIEEQKGIATGEERPPASDSSSDDLDRAINRLVGRLDKAASKLEMSLSDRENLSAVPPQAIARQIWMAHIAAFLAARVQQSHEGEDFVCLEPWYFANYILRVCRAFTGSKAGGFLDKLPPDSWEGLDGESLKRGLSFLWTCVVWSAAFMVHYYANGPGKEECAESLAVASAELVAARFVWKVRQLDCSPDEVDMGRRFPALQEVSTAQLVRTKARVDHIVSLIERAESKQDPAVLGTEESAQSCRAGTLVFNQKIGVTILYKDGEPKSFYAIDYSKTDQDQIRFGARIAPVLSGGKPFAVYLAAL